VGSGKVTVDPLGQAATGVEHIRTNTGACGQLGVVDDPRLAGERSGAHVARQHDLVKLDLASGAGVKRGSGADARLGVCWG
jgi:hypothetical protein